MASRPFSRDEEKQNPLWDGSEKFAGRSADKAKRPANTARGWVSQKDKSWIWNLCVSKVVDENGEPLAVWHGSKSKHNVYDQVHTFHISNRNVASGYGDVVDGNFVNARNVLEIDADGGEWLSVNTPDTLIGRFKDGEEIEDGRGFTATFDSYSMSVRDIATFAKKAGYDGVVIRNVEDTNESTGELGTDIVTFSPYQVKSADPVTYDDAGNVVIRPVL